ncbi:uncharacterized protein Dwil_GK22337 [Drosophila willistoni]|uniref:Uncharacterized protein n=1 Tax=Drosophila willistoni TaxID=7260 RepID=B4NF24_DROWI|nr:uncharacterized protein LOC6649463 [Drosophila willistoni]EDW83399.2 uncharacterized protein Dwil_GK22337 [Drosophila willistoni]
MLTVKIFILSVLLCPCVGNGQGPTTGCSLKSNQQSQLKSIVPRIFTRKRRALLFPPGSFLKFTCSLATGLLAAYPSGVSFVLEEAVYFPVPGTINDIYPKRYLPKTTTKTPEILPDSIVYIPGTDWNFKAKTLPKPKWRNRPTHRWDHGKYGNPYKWQKWNKYDTKWQDKTNWSKWTTEALKWNKDWKKYETEWQPKTKWSKLITSTPNWKQYENHRHYPGHRDRRQLFERFSQLSSLVGFDIKSCILRTMCDSKRLLLPPGYSMLHDMLGIVFTMPRIDGLEDVYSEVMSKDANECSRQLKSKCNMNLLIWLLSGKTL